jgi:PAS domain S-box-containing protein
MPPKKQARKKRLPGSKSGPKAKKAKGSKTKSVKRKSGKSSLVRELQLRDVLFSSLAQATRELLLNPDWSEALGVGLKLLGEATNVDRVYLFENDPQKEGQELTTSQRFEWNSGTALPQIDNPELQNLPYSLVKESFEPLRSNRPYVEIVSRMNKKSTFRKILEDEHIMSVLLFPIFVRNHFWGFIGFDECKYEREWSEVEFSVLSSYSATISGSINRKQIEDRIEITLQQALESEHRFRTLQQASYSGIAMHSQGVIMDCNQGLSELTGYSYDELVGTDGVMLIAPEYREMVRTKIRTGYDKPYDAEGIKKDGSRIVLEINGKTIHFANRIIRVTEFRDITERKRAEEKTLEQNARLTAIASDLKRKNDQLEEFAQIVSHNLRAPIGNILSLISFYEDSHKKEEKEEYFNLLKTSSQAVNNTFNELVEVLKIRQNTNIERQTLSFALTLDKVKRMFAAKIATKQAAITEDFQVKTVVYPNIYLESIFLNLLSNSLKYRQNGVPPVISFKTYLQDGNTILEVSDNGLGIDLNKYGHQVFKLNKTFHLHPEARGIGLFITKNQIEAMGGEIKVFSKPNEGATFVVNFDKNART